MEHLAYMVAAPMLKLVTKELGSLLKERIVEVWQVGDNLRDLEATYLQIDAMLGRLDRSQKINSTPESWLLDLEGHCYDTEDLVDHLILSGLNPSRGNIFMPGRISIPNQIGELQKNLKVTGDLIQKLLSSGAIDLSSSTQSEQPSAEQRRRLSSDKTSLALGTSRDKDKQKISEKLRNDSCGVSIIGMDGLGKTALARSILNDEAIKAHFPLVLSASVSGHFQMEDTIKELVAGHTKKTMLAAESYEHLEELLRGSLRSLIVLDDLWAVSYQEWSKFVSNCLNSAQEWRILTTTRNPKVAHVTKTAPYYLNTMTEEDCKKVIIHRAELDAADSETWSSDITDIASKCKGMPIIANMYGLRLSYKEQRKASIVQFKNTDLSKLQEFREVFPSLNLNKPMLLPHLKRCLAYFSLFPPTHEFNKDELIQLWESERFIQHEQTASSKDALNQCFDDLLSRSILQPLESTDNNNQPVYRMHEFNHEFAHLIASKAFCKVEEGTNNLLSSCKNIRHLSLATHSTGEGPLLKEIEQCKGLRTFLLLHQKAPKTRVISYSYFHKLHRLRLLDLSHTNINELPKPVSPSKHLRYLDLSYTQVKKLPEPIRSLRALQTLKLKGCSKLRQLPKDLNQLISLTHLHVDMRTLRDKPSDIGKLTKLEVLDSFLVGRNKGYKVRELKNMKHLTEIRIYGLQNIKDKEEARETMLIEKSWLRTLVLEWDEKRAAQVINASDVLEGLQPHNHLEELTLRNYGGKQFPTWLISPACQLVSIYLNNCQALPSLGQLPLLKNLVVRSVHSLRTLDSQFHGQGKEGFPCLELLELRDMEVVVNWVGLKAGDMPCLRTLKTIGCPKLISLPSFEHQGKLINLEISNCPDLQSLPKLPSSLNSEAGELIIMHSALVTQRCQFGGELWPIIKDIPYVEIDATRILTKSSSQALENDKEQNSCHKDPLAANDCSGNKAFSTCFVTSQGTSMTNNTQAANGVRDNDAGALAAPIEEAISDSSAFAETGCRRDSLAAKDCRGNKAFSTCFVTYQGTSMTNNTQAANGVRDNDAGALDARIEEAIDDSSAFAEIGRSVAD